MIESEASFNVCVTKRRNNDCPVTVYLHTCDYSGQDKATGNIYITFVYTYLHIYKYTHTHIYVYIHTYMCVQVNTEYVYIQNERLYDKGHVCVILILYIVSIM